VPHFQIVAILQKKKIQLTNWSVEVFQEGWRSYRKMQQKIKIGGVALLRSCHMVWFWCLGLNQYDTINVKCTSVSRFNIHKYDLAEVGNWKTQSIWTDMNAALIMIMVRANLLAFPSTVRNMSVARVSIRLVVTRAALILSFYLSVNLF